MKKLTKFMLKRYAQIPGEQKIRLGMELSEIVREVRRNGKQATGR